MCCQRGGLPQALKVEPSTSLTTKSAWCTWICCVSWIRHTVKEKYITTINEIWQSTNFKTLYVNWYPAIKEQCYSPASAYGFYECKDNISGIIMQCMCAVWQLSLKHKTINVRQWLPMWFAACFAENVIASVYILWVNHLYVFTILFNISRKDKCGKFGRIWHIYSAMKYVSSYGVPSYLIII